MSLELVFDCLNAPFAAESREAMLYSILAFCEGKGASVLYEPVSEDSVRVYVDDKVEQKVFACYNKASDYCAEGKFEGAKNSLYKLFKLWPFHSDSYRLMAQILFLKQDYDKAIDTNLDALRFDPKNLWALILMGNILTAKGNLQGADGYYSKVLEYHPDNALALNNLGGVYCKRKDYARGVEYLQKAVDIDPACISAYYGLALARYNQGRYQDSFDIGVKGLMQGAERVENVKIVPHLAEQVYDAAERIAEKTDFFKMAMDVAKDIEKRFNTTVRFIEDDKIAVLAHLEFASQHKRDYHVIRYRQSGHFGHLVLHELMHLVMMQEALDAGRLKTVGSDQENFDLFMERNAKVFDAVRRDFGVARADGLAEQMFKGLSVQTLSVPLDLFVEQKIYSEYPQFRAAQYASLYQMDMDNLKAVTDSANIRYFPQKVKDVNRTLNMVSAMFSTNRFGSGNVLKFATKDPEMTNAMTMFWEFEQALKSFKPGDEYSLFESFAKRMDMLDYFRVSMTESVGETSFKTESSRKQEAFDKRHANGDPIVDAMMSQYMLGALRAFAQMEPEDVAAVARECAVTGMGGIKTDGSAMYKLAAFPSKDFSGYEFLAYYYVSWAQAFPEMLLETGLPFHHAYELARQMFERE